MNQKVSLFSFGMLRLGMELQDLKDELGEGGLISPQYDWDKNRINIVTMFDGQTLTTERCVHFIREINSRAAVDPATGNPIFGEYSAYAGLFNDIGFEIK